MIWRQGRLRNAEPKPSTPRVNHSRGANSLTAGNRKTFGYMHRVVHGTDIPTLMVMFNHSSQRQTLDYLGIGESEVHDAYMKEI